ncbi:RNA polymerase II-associated protein 3 [Haplosporangium sp. Z 767]|nr:RNA polymerase II-associated protein 3 [Haplosporangium sp. Z 767]KAF9191626.1 RNA polymerase II-associated protein 3 [Haplosporangium sp. Z 11]
MDAATLQRIAQWEQAHAKGNRKPLAAREYPPLREKNDIILQEIRSVPLASKSSHIGTGTAAPSITQAADKIGSTASGPSSDTTQSKPHTNSGNTRKAYYESWDKFDVDKALVDMDKSVGDDKFSGESRASNPAVKKTGTTGSTAATPDAIATANAEKEKGNEFFKKGQYLKAIERYSASMALDPSNPLLPINKAMALLKLERFSEAEQACSVGLQLDSRSVKALWRRGIARRSLGKVQEANVDFEAALKIDPANKAVKDELAKLQQQQQQQQQSTPKTSTSSAPKFISKQQTKKDEPMPLVTKSSSSSSTTTPIISSKRVAIKEIENDQDSKLFLSKTKAPTSPIEPSQLPTKPAEISLSTVAKSPTVSTPTQTPVAIPTSSLSSVPKIPVEEPKRSSLNIQMTAPTTTLDFQRDWKSYSRDKGLLYQYIKLIQPEALPAIFKSSFESDYLSSMLTVFRDFYVPTEEPLLLYRYLLNLTKVQRFDMTLMFMTGSDKKDLAAIFQHLSSHVNDNGTYNQQSLATLASRYKTTIV